MIMKIEKISENMIKVTITLSDLEERNIDLSSLNYNSPATQELFWDMMEQAEEQYGFNMADSQLVIEPVPDSNEGFIITITKIDEDSDFESIQKYIRNRLRKSDLRVRKRGHRILTPMLVYSFRSLEDVHNLSLRVEDIYCGESTLYKYRETYYLFMRMSSILTSFNENLEIVLSEYGKKVNNTAYTEGFLNEYGEKIIENNALEILREYY